MSKTKSISSKREQAHSEIGSMFFFFFSAPWKVNFSRFYSRLGICLCFLFDFFFF